MDAEKIVAGAHGHAHKPMLKGGFAAVAGEFLKSFGPDLLDDVFDLTFTPRIAARGGEYAGRILLHERLELRSVPFQDCRNKFRFRGFHWAEGYAKPTKNSKHQTSNFRKVGSTDER